MQLEVAVMEIEVVSVESVVAAGIGVIVKVELSFLVETLHLEFALFADIEPGMLGLDMLQPV